MKINEITINPQMTATGDPLRFRVNEAIEINGQPGHIVKKITYNPVTRLFNKGLEVGNSCYTVYFNDIPERRIIMDNTVTSIEAVKDDNKKNNDDVANEAGVPLPA